MARGMDPINITIMAHIQNTGIRPAPIGQVPSRLSPPMAPLNDTNSFISPIALQEQFNSDHRRQLTRHVRALIVDEPIQLGSTNMNIALGHPLQRTVFETRQPARSAQSHRRGPQQAPTFVPVSQDLGLKTNISNFIMVMGTGYQPPYTIQVTFCE